MNISMDQPPDSTSEGPFLLFFKALAMHQILLPFGVFLLVANPPMRRQVFHHSGNFPCIIPYKKRRSLETVLDFQVKLPAIRVSNLSWILA